MSMYNFLPLVGKRISVAIDTNKPLSKDVKETYIGVLKQVYDDYIILDFIHLKGTSNRRDNLKQIIIRRQFIVSIWVYDD